MKTFIGLGLLVLLLLSACNGVGGEQAAGPKVTVYKEPG